MIAGVNLICLQNDKAFPWISLYQSYRSLVLRNAAFRLQPLKMSSDLITQLNAVSTKLNSVAGQLQELIKEKKNKNRHYQEILPEALISQQVCYHFS